MDRSYKSGNPKGNEIPAHPGHLGGPQPLLSGTSQGFNFYVSDLDVIEVELDSFDDTLCSVEGESDRPGFWWGISFSCDGRRGESAKLKGDPRSMDDLPFFVVARLGFLDAWICKVLLWLLFLSNVGDELGDDFCGYGFQGFCNVRDILTDRVDIAAVGNRSGRTAVLTSGGEEGGGMEGRRNGSGLCLSLVVIQFGNFDVGSSNKFPLRDIEGKELSKEEEDDPGVKSEDAEHKADELLERDSLDGKSYVAGIARGGSGFGSCLARSQLFVDIWTRGRLAGSQGGFGRLVVNVMNVNCGNLIGRLLAAIWETQRLSLGLDRIQGRGRRRGEQTVVGLVWEPSMLGEDGEVDVTVGFNEIVNW